METIKVFNGYALMKINDNSFLVLENGGESKEFKRFFDAVDYFKIVSNI